MSLWTKAISSSLVRQVEGLWWLWNTSRSIANHIVFFRQHKEYTTLLVVYVEGIISTGNNEGEIALLKVQLGKEFEVKDLGFLQYFLGIEVARGVGVV